nr:type I restriction enzyme endonuclease domain-containing protein [Sporosarcina psychrophila]
MILVRCAGVIGYIFLFYEGVKSAGVNGRNRLLQGKVKKVQRKNLVKAQKFTVILNNAINKYNKCSIETSNSMKS